MNAPISDNRKFTLGIRFAAEALIFCAVIGGLSDSSYLFSNKPELVREFSGALRFVTSASIFAGILLLPWMLIVNLTVSFFSRIRKSKPEITLTLLYFLGFLPLFIIIARNFALLNSDETLYLTDLKSVFYFLKYLFVLIPVGYAVSHFLAVFRLSGDYSVMVSRLSGFFVGAGFYLILTPMIQSKIMTDRINTTSVALTNRENLIITLGIFILSLLLIPVGIRISGFLYNKTKGIALAAVWIFGILFPFTMPFFSENPLYATAKSGNQISGKKSNVILISMDTVRYDDLGFNGSEIVKTPNLDAMAEQSLVFDNAFTPMPLTGPAHMSMMTGLQPDSDYGHRVKANGVPLAEKIPTLATVLDSQGYDTAGIVSSFILSREASGLHRGFHYYHDQFETGKFSKFVSPSIWETNPGKLLRKFFPVGSSLNLGKVKRAAQVTDEAIEWLDSQDGSPFFLFVHYYDAHYSYDPPDTWKNKYYPDYSGKYRSEYLKDTDIPEAVKSFAPEDFEWFRAQYRAEISYMDSEIGRLFQYLESKKILDNSLLIVVSDHGESFDHDYYFDHEERVYDSTIHVPLFIRDPESSQNGTRNRTSLVNISDIFFTALAYLDLASPIDAKESNAMIPGNEPDWNHDIRYGEGWNFILSQSYSISTEPPGRFFSMRSKEHKLIYGPDAEPSYPQMQLFFLLGDKDEKNNIYYSTNWLRSQPLPQNTLIDWASRQGIVDLSSLDPQVREELKSLGYIN